MTSFFVKEVQAQIQTRNGVATLKGLEGVFERIVTVALGFAALATFVMLLSGGLRYITSGGDPKKAEAAKNTLTFAVGGLVLTSLAYLILRLIGVFTVADIGNFRVTVP